MKRTSATWAVLTGVVAAAVGGLASPQAKFHYRQGGQLHAVFFLPSDTSKGWIAADGGRIHKSTTSGNFWDTADVPDEVKGELRGVYFLPPPNQNTGFAVGDGGVILKSLTAGLTWTDLNPTNRIKDSRGTPPPACQNDARLYDTFMFSDQEGVVVGYDGAIRKTTTGWTSWTTPSLPPDFNCGVHDPFDAYDVHFFANASPPYSRGIICADWGVILTTADSGDTWTRVDVAPNPSLLCPIPIDGTGGWANIELWQLAFDDPADPASLAHVVGGVGTNQSYSFRSVGGWPYGTWQQIRCYDYEGFNLGAIHVHCGNGGGGPTHYGVTTLDASGEAVIGGYDSQLLHYTSGTSNYSFCTCQQAQDPSCPSGGSTWVQVSTIPDPPEPIDACGASPPFAEADKISSTRACIVGSFGRIVIFDKSAPLLVDRVQDKGTTHFSRLGDGEFIDALTGTVIGQGNIFKRTANGGFTWQDAAMTGWSCDGNSQGLGLDFSTGTSLGQYGVGVGTGGFIAKSADFGASWTKVTVTPTPPELRAVAFAPQTAFPPGNATVYVVGAAGYVARSDDSGRPGRPSPPQRPRR